MSGEWDITSTCINDEAMYDDKDACKSLHSCELEDLGDDTRADSLATLTERESVEVLAT